MYFNSYWIGHLFRSCCHMHFMDPWEMTCKKHGNESPRQLTGNSCEGAQPTQHSCQQDSHGSKPYSLHFRNLYIEASRILQYCTNYMFILLRTISSIMHTKALEAFSIPTRRKHSQSRWQEGKLTCNLRHCWTTCSNSLSSCTHRTVCKKLETREKEGPNKTKWLEHHHRFCSKSHSCISQQTCKFPQDSKTTYDIPSFYKIQSICSCHEASKIQPSPLTTCHLHQLLSYLCTNAISLSTLQFR